MSNLKILILFVAFGLFLKACDSSSSTSPIDPEEPNIVEVAAANEQFSTLVSALQDADLVGALEGAGPFTVFAPTNDAFAGLPDGTLESLTSEQLTDILTYHVITAEVPSTALQPTQTVTALNDQELFITAENGNVTVNGNAGVITADITASNGIIHAVNQVLLPDAFGTIVDNAQKRYFLSTLVSAVVDAGLAPTLSDAEAEFTVFAPTNEAFDAIADVLPTLTPEELTNVLLYHVLDTSVLSSDLQGEQTVPTLAGSDITVTVTDGTVQINDAATVISADNVGTNGVIHVIDTVLIPGAQDNTIPGIAAGNPDFSTLVDALGQAGLIDALSGEGPFTVFAPTNDAFESLPEGTLESLTLDQLTGILTYHAIAAAVASGDLEPEQTVATLGGEPIFITFDGTNVTVNGTATVTIADIEASNGFIHAIDGVLLPDIFGSVVDNAIKRYYLSTLVGAVIDADLVTALSDEDANFTVFAPTNDAFDAIADILPTLTPEQVTEVLLYHVLDTRVLSGDITGEAEVPTLNGQSVTVNVVNGNVVINEDATVTEADVDGTNGVIHVIDAVLIPEL
ncbi:transforming growth factor-beta-induced protein [Cyclonatronum proteinivorum]|uniref:Transforming growth factor-beta-induced protein n=1 Tax=Cyclonatronum proteinivorum TaxID=1457365 RepID=A0A345UPJ9_9BACT|nr:fasciclin domain-containing protein [Cyclonatronum proteinivorum]AXJ02401.1 transforming growth factor-beta-induced protein [Cyclonatronum proteinivorum]